MRLDRHGVLRGLLAIAGLAALTVVLVAVDASLAVASLAFVMLVVLCALMGYWSGTVAVAGSFVALNYFFTDPIHSLRVTKTDDLVPLLAFGVVAVALSATVARVTELRRRAELREREAFDARLAAALGQSRAGFLSAMTHSLRTPLASIKAAVSTLRAPGARLGEREREDLLATAYEECDRLERLVTKVLELSRIRAGALEVRREPSDLADLARAAVRRLRHLASRQRVRLVVDGAVPVMSVDPTMMELVLVSLLENALRFAPAGTEVEVHATLGVDGACELRVVDRGPGIPAEHHEKVFEEFVRLGGPPDGTGAGLGLAIARAFVDAHDGTLRIEETPSGGATFVIALPVRRVATS